MQDNKSLVTRVATRYGVDSTKFFDTLKATAFKQKDGGSPTNEQMMTLLIVAEQYNLNPFTREIYAFPDKQNGIIPVVGVDGWSRIINDHPQYDGIEFVYSDKMVKMDGAKVDCPEWIDAVIYRKDRSRPIKIREFLDEVYRAPFKGNGRNGSYLVDGPWQTHTKRQLRHKAIIQCSRIAFGFGGIYDQDEAERIKDMGDVVLAQPQAKIEGSSNSSNPEVEFKQLNPLLKQLAERAEKQNAWSAAYQYSEERFHGAELEYATKFLQDKELEAIGGDAEVEEEENTTSIQDESNHPPQEPEFSPDEDDPKGGISL
jgi:phage recombination protein Bet